MSSLLKTKKLDSVIWAGTPGKDTQNTVPASENRFGWFLVFFFNYGDRSRYYLNFSSFKLGSKTETTLLGL